MKKIGKKILKILFFIGMIPFVLLNVVVLLSLFIILYPFTKEVTDD